MRLARAFSTAYARSPTPRARPPPRPAARAPAARRGSGGWKARTVPCGPEAVRHPPQRSASSASSTSASARAGSRRSRRGAPGKVAQQAPGGGASYSSEATEELRVDRRPQVLELQREVEGRRARVDHLGKRVDARERERRAEPESLKARAMTAPAAAAKGRGARRRAPRCGRRGGGACSRAPSTARWVRRIASRTGGSPPSRSAAGRCWRRSRPSPPSARRGGSPPACRGGSRPAPRAAASTAAHAAASTAKAVVPSARARARSASRASGDRRKARLAPEKLCVAGRGRSAGSSSTRGAPSSSFTNQATASAAAPRSSWARCHAAKSRKRSGGGARRASPPRAYAA
jgi:hypothetical protein